MTPSVGGQKKRALSFSRLRGKYPSEARGMGELLSDRYDASEAPNIHSPSASPSLRAVEEKPGDDFYIESPP